MPVDNLLRPENRLLGLGTGDFSYYGGQPDPAVAFTHVGAAPAPARDGDSDAAAAQVAAPTAPDAPPTDAAHGDDGPTVQPGGAAPAAAPTPPSGDHAAPDPAAGSAPISSASTPPAILNPQPVAAPDGTGVADASSAITPAGDLAGGHGFATIAPVLAGLEGFAAVTAQLAPVAAQLSATTAILGDVAGSVPHALDGVATAAQGAIGGVGTVAQATVDDALGTAQGVAADATGTVDTLAGAPVHDVDALIFGGTDPSGGIATLVDMVQTSELFTVGQAETPAPAPDASGSIVDSLIGDAATSTPILGADHSHDLIDDHGLHLGL